jgi:hypothetical protein
VEASANLAAKATKDLDVIRVTRDGTLEFTLTGSGDMDVYAKKGGKPQFDADSGQPKRGNTLNMYEEGSNGRKSIPVKAGEEINVTLRGYVASNAKLTIKQL